MVTRLQNLEEDESDSQFECDKADKSFKVINHKENRAK